MRFSILAALLAQRVSAFSSSLGQQRPQSVLRAETTPIADELNHKTAWQVDDSYTTTESGLQYKDIVVGTGESPDDGGTVTVHYSFWFDDFTTGEEGALYFTTKDTKSNPKQEPMSFQTGEKAQIVKGWVEGMSTMKAGGTRILILPPDLAYGKTQVPSRGAFPAIPSGSHLRFEVELKAVDNSPLTKFRRAIKKPSSLFDANVSWFG